MLGAEIVQKLLAQYRNWFLSKEIACSVVFYGNISSFSSHAQGFLCSLPTVYKAIACVEHHKADVSNIQSAFRNSRSKTSITPPETATGGGTHGGEFIATREHIYSTPVNPELLEHIATTTSVPLGLAARFVRLRDIIILLVTTYLWCSEGFTERNNVILLQLHLLQIISLTLS